MNGSPEDGGARAGRAALGGIAASERAALEEVLESLAAREAKIAESLYPLLFARRPDVVPLFGVHALAEREEMVRETLRSLLALAEGEDHLWGNLTALGRSHFEYGVTADMYPDFVDVFVEVAAGDFDETRRALLRQALDEITQAMRRAGDDAARAIAARR